MSYSIDSIGSSAQSHYASLFAKLDSDGDSKVSKSEFVAGAPEGVDADKASELFDYLDQEGGGFLSESDLASAFEQISSEMKSVLLEAQEQKRPISGGAPDISELFSSLDSDEDGILTREEFVAGRPEGVSEEDAGNLFDQISEGSEDGITEEQFSSAAPPPPPPPAGGGQGPSAASSVSDSDSDEEETANMIEELLEILQSDDSDTSSQTSTILQAIEAYRNAA